MERGSWRASRGCARGRMGAGKREPRRGTNAGSHTAPLCLYRPLSRFPPPRLASVRHPFVLRNRAPHAAPRSRPASPGAPPLPGRARIPSSSPLGPPPRPASPPRPLPARLRVPSPRPPPSAHHPSPHTHRRSTPTSPSTTPRSPLAFPGQPNAPAREGADPSVSVRRAFRSATAHLHDSKIPTKRKTTAPTSQFPETRGTRDGGARSRRGSPRARPERDPEAERAARALRGGRKMLAMRRAQRLG